MPYTRKKKYQKKRGRKSRKTIFRPQRLIPTGFPKSTAVKLRYVEAISIDPPIGAVGHYTFRANSVFDPNNTGVGHQPMGYDQWSVFYNHYVVVGSKITITTTANSGPGVGMLLTGVVLTDTPATFTDFTEMMEQGLAKTQKQSVHLNAQRPKSLSKGFSAKKFFNVTNVLDNVSRLGANTGVNPTEVAYFSVFAANSKASADQTVVDFVVTVEYIVVFSEPRELEQS